VGFVLACSIDDFQAIITVDIEVDLVLTNLTVRAALLCLTAAACHMLHADSS
jgi:hypothetical protein